MSLARQLAAGRTTFRAALAEVYPVHDGLKCHAGAGHTVAVPRGCRGDLCDACTVALTRLLGRFTPSVR